MRRKAEAIRKGVRHLRRIDPVMRHLISDCPPLTDLALERDRFFSLASSILSQQISIHAARTVKQRLRDHTEPDGITPESIRRLDVEQMRALGLSRQKAGYLKDLAEKVADGTVSLARMVRRTDERVIRDLTGIRGIGVWTAQMFLIFSLGRLDVFPVDDYGIRSALQRLYGLKDLPDKAGAEAIANPWRPYRTIASWYCWRSLELEAASPLPPGESREPGRRPGRPGRPITSARSGPRRR